MKPTPTRTTAPRAEIDRVLGHLPRVIASPIGDGERRAMIGMVAQAKRSPGWTPTAWQMRAAQRLVAAWMREAFAGEGVEGMSAVVEEGRG